VPGGKRGGENHIFGALILETQRDKKSGPLCGKKKHRKVTGMLYGQRFVLGKKGHRILKRGGGKKKVTIIGGWPGKKRSKTRCKRKRPGVKKGTEMKVKVLWEGGQNKRLEHESEFQQKDVGVHVGWGGEGDAILPLKGKRGGHRR